MRERPWWRWLSGVACASFLLVAVAPGALLALLPTDTSTADTACFIENRLESPSGEHWLGTDGRGCNYLPRIVKGASVSLKVALGAITVATVVAVALGSVAGYYGGAVDAFVSRLTDAALALPALVGVFLVLAVISVGDERTPIDIAIALGAVAWPVLLRIVRASVIKERARGYVEATQALGLANPGILLRHVLPNALGPLLAYTTIAIGVAVSAEATLTFLGVGLPDDTISWGRQIAEGQRLARAGTAYHVLLFPALALALTSAGFVLVGERLQLRLEAQRRAHSPDSAETEARLMRLGAAGPADTGQRPAVS